MKINRPLALDLVLWVLSVLLAYMFLKQGSAKFDDGSGWAAAFRAWNYPDWFRMAIGAIEVSAALLLLTRRTASIGAAMIVVVMIGAMGTHIMVGRPQHMTSEIVPITLAIIIALGRRHALFFRRPLLTQAV